MNPDVKSCENCGGEFTRNIGKEGVAEFAGRRYCRRACAAAARRTLPPKPPKAAKATDLESVQLRIVDGLWRPSAPGWPDRPRVRQVAS